MYTVHNLEKARYEVNVRVTSKDYDDEGDAHEVYWTVLSGILYDDFTYPNRVLVGLKALATDQLSGGFHVSTGAGKKKCLGLESEYWLI